MYTHVNTHQAVYYDLCILLCVPQKNTQIDNGYLHGQYTLPK